MARPKSSKPAYCLHKARGYAFVKIDGRQFPLGRHGSPESHDMYDRLIGEWIARGRRSPIVTAAEPSQTIVVAEVINAFWKHCQEYHVSPEGEPAKEQHHFKQALAIVNRLYGPTPATVFGPLALKSVRAEMLKPVTSLNPRTRRKRTLPAWSRKYVNRQVGRIKYAFRWAVENELISGSVYHALCSVAGLRCGHTEARETAPIKPVLIAYVDAVLPLVPRQVKAIIQLQLLSGARPGEVCAMRGRDIDMTGGVWIYSPAKHKTAHHGHTREIRIGPKAQAVIKPFLKSDLQAYLFSPAEADKERRAKFTKARVTPKKYGNRPGTNRKKHPAKTPGERYTTGSYRCSITSACIKAGVPPFHPHQLRHNAATALRKEFGIEAARIILGHRSAAVTTIYAEADTLKATEIMAKVG